MIDNLKFRFHSYRAYWMALASLGCIACRKDGHFVSPVSIHHIDGRTKPDASWRVLPLCARHHQTGGKDAPAIHPWKRRFEERYGTQAELMAECVNILMERRLNDSKHPYPPSRLG